ncbi:MAG: histidine phosphatase family protein [Candidatus Marsarchaeota archaeon]|jgi:broad specificity phosphatase PhoE|nr:histidine phosphatase family protein [Candidatus Marsarchaeota archaeon]
MERLYLVRHGRTTLNENGVYQASEADLSESGISQAKAVAKRFSSKKIDLIISSNTQRAKRTAGIINASINAKLLQTDMLNEKKLPSFFYGKSANDKSIAKVLDELIKHDNDVEWHYSDEENYSDFMKRLNGFIKYVESLKEDSAIVVTHSGVIKALTILFMKNEMISTEIFASWLSFLHTENTGITELLFKSGNWRLLTYNDYTHLI